MSSRAHRLGKHLGKRRVLSSVLIGAGAIACSSTPQVSRGEATGTASSALTASSCQALDVAARADSTYAIALDGKVYGWGYNAGDSTKSPFFPLGHRSTDSDIQLGNQVTTPKYLGVANAKQVVAGHDGACALINDGTVTCWGELLGYTGGYQQFLTNGLYKPATVQALTSTGDGAPLTGVTAITYGDQHACALKSDGTVWCWGDDSAGQLGDPDSDGNPGGTSMLAVQVSGAANVTRVAAAGSTTCVLRTTSSGIGEIDCAGDNLSGQLGQGSGGESGNVPHPTLTRINVPSNFDFGALYGGGTGTFCASTKKVGSAQATYCWGANAFGQVGHGDKAVGTNSPIQISSDIDPADVDATWAQGNLIGCKANAVGEVWCWGTNSFGGIAGVSHGDVLTKTRIAGVSGAFKVAVGDGHVCALANGSLSCWGDNIDGQIGNGQVSTVDVVVTAHRLSVPVLPACGTGGVGQICGALTNTCGETADCGSCTALNSCDATSHTCKDDPNKCSPACGSGNYCSNHTCFNYCGTLPITDASIGTTVALSSAPYTVTAPANYGLNDCGSYIIDMGNYRHHEIIVQPPAAVTSQLDCGLISLTAATYGNGKLLNQIGPLQGQWITSTSTPYCKFDTLNESSIRMPSPQAAYSDVRVTARLETLVASGKGSIPYDGNAPVKVQIISLCTNGIKDGNESGIDCGGSCAACPVPVATCDDGIKNGNETGVDCGGSCISCDFGECHGNPHTCVPGHTP